ncbi:MAG TPA: succinylglutamate-semialdehyde dehydrogenase [Rhizomicrobium sp.]|nr:succinylglutamate-semialdehyde dehydrogenase [Rhizomicrobium sp.]
MSKENGKSVRTIVAGGGPAFTKTNPADGEVLWQGASATAAQCEAAVSVARKTFEKWSAMPLASRIAVVRDFAERLKARADVMSRDIARETGKPLWEAKTEHAAMVGKIEVSIAAQEERAGSREAQTAFGRSVLRHHPHGVMAILGPYNFPGHLPNGQIVPALLAGDTVVFKPSELTPLTGQHVAECWAETDLPNGVFHLVQGGRETGAALLAADIDGLLFTGSAAAGAYFRRLFVDRPHVILALELGGNNSLIAWDGDPAAAASIIVHSAFMTAGQRCTDARRLIIPQGRDGEEIIAAVNALTDRLRIGSWDEVPEPFMGCLISAAAADKARADVAALLNEGAKTLRLFGKIAGRSDAFVAPGLIDVTGVGVPDAEIFAPLLQVIRVSDFDAAITAANDTKFGLAAGLITEHDHLWQRYLTRARAGVINRNRPTSGASPSMPFGGVGESGNHRPASYYMADHVAYPVASFEAPSVRDISTEMKGLETHAGR